MSRLPLRHALLIVLPAVTAAACARTGAGPAAGAPPAAQAAAPNAAAPDAAELRRDLFAFAADSFRGRETGTPDADRAARWLVAHLARLGLDPAGDSGFFQRVPMTRATLSVREIALTDPRGRHELALGRDILVLGSLGPGAPRPKLDADADIVFASYAVVDSTLRRDDLASLQLAGKTVVAVVDAPAGADSAARARWSGAEGLSARLQHLLGRGAAAVVLLVPDSLYELAAGQFGGAQIALGPQPSAIARMLPLTAIAPLRATSPFLPQGWPATDGSRLSSGTRLTAHLTERAEPFTAYNVVAVARGSDPALRSTYVAFGAHYDHIGIQPATNGDSIANGADDDGSGSVSLLAIARAWTQGPRPRRSALFVWHVGEEKGLLGSQWFTDHPTVPIDSIVAQLNADMIGRNGPDSLYIVGPHAAPNGQSRVLGTIVDSVNAALPRPFTIDRTWDSPAHPERIYFRSDHFMYARKGIPIIFFTTGLHPQYHRVTDEPQLIDYPKMARVATLMYDTGIAVANRLTRPR